MGVFKMEFQQTVQAILDRAVEKGEVAGANAMVLQNGKELGYFESGFAEIESKKPIERNTIFRLYSMSKPITGAAAMLLMENGLLDLEAPVSKYLPGFRNQKVWTEDGLESVRCEARVKDLLTMTSGLSYDGDLDEPCRRTTAVFRELGSRLNSDLPMTTLEFANAIGECPLAFQPGTLWRYGTSADVLGAVIELVSGMRLSEFLKKNLFDPLEMGDTGFYVPAEKQNRLARVYEEMDGHLVPFYGNHLGIRNDMAKAPAFESGGAGLVSTIDDYAKFTQMLHDGGVYRGKTIMKPGTLRFFVSPSLNAKQRELVGHPGYSYGNLMRVLVEPGSATAFGFQGQYSWGGWLGTDWMNVPSNGLTVLYMVQRAKTGTNTFRLIQNAVFSEF